MPRYVCIHGHFYQPPRETPGLDAVLTQSGAAPWHDWNEKIWAECYAPNAAARVLDKDGFIARLSCNYARMSFNFGPTLLTWLERERPETYVAILDADRKSRERHGGHGAAMAQAYNHSILPLCNARDRDTQIAWGVADFEHRYGRKPEGMWLAETAIDTPALEAMAERGIRFTIVAPSQVRRVRKLGEGAWTDVSGGRIDARRAYLARLPSGRSIAVFAYHAALSQAVAFERMLDDGARFAQRLLGAFDATAPAGASQLVHIATDGETYGHHHRFGEMALAFALDHIEAQSDVRLTNYAEFLELAPPQHEIEWFEPSAWSCAHGVGRWSTDCGCNFGTSGPNGRFSQVWRSHLREALDVVRDGVMPMFEREGARVFQDVWAARDAYVDVVLDRSPATLDRFFARHGLRPTDSEARVVGLRLMELQRQAMAMYTSCGWFFDDLAGIETQQVLAHADRVLQLAASFAADEIAAVERSFLAVLERARSNVPQRGDGKQIHLGEVAPRRVELADVAAHAAVRRLFQPVQVDETLYAYAISSTVARREQHGRSSLVVTRVDVRSTQTGESGAFEAVAAHLGDLSLVASARPATDATTFDAWARELAAGLHRGEPVRLAAAIEAASRRGAFTLRTLWHDERTHVLRHVLRAALGDVDTAYRRILESAAPLVRFLEEVGEPLPTELEPAMHFALQRELDQTLAAPEPDLEHLARCFAEAKRERKDAAADANAMRMEDLLRRAARAFAARPDERVALARLARLLDVALEAPFGVDVSAVQEIVFRIGANARADGRRLANAGDANARAWLDAFERLCERLRVRP
ncbi:MAG: DUF3536 domain-containing protein [Planctomycetes bacterium]|nr:DUF3536 domain-containing protein [Planctomycetota bacterium]MCC7169193.1 DUF3536 domain-containing protein [Planctomycetota bacterium]